MITRILCSKNRDQHMLGHIDADAAGLVLTYYSAVSTSPSDPAGVRSPQDGYHYRRDPAERELREPRDAVTEIDLWCAGCKTGHPVDVGALFGAAKQRRRVAQLASRGASDGLWQVAP